MLFIAFGSCSGFLVKSSSLVVETGNAASESQELLFFSSVEHCTENFKLLLKILKMSVLDCLMT